MLIKMGHDISSDSGNVNNSWMAIQIQLYRKKSTNMGWQIIINTIDGSMSVGIGYGDFGTETLWKTEPKS